MNLRINQGQLRFRITREELRALLQGDTMGLMLPLSKSKLHYCIRGASLESPLSIQETTNGLTLEADRDALTALEKQLPSREGIEHAVALNGNHVLLVLEVDVRKFPR
jgi:hypothetical protein